MNAPSPPRHVAIIMDGNGRWASRHGLPRVEGHRAGAKAVHRIVRYARELGLEALTLYAFSEQNWARPEPEVEALMHLLVEYVRSQREEILGNDIRLSAIGDLSRLPDFVRDPLHELMQASAENTGMVLTLALSYGGREEIVRAARRLVAAVAEGRLELDDLDEAAFEAGLDTAGLPPLDLLIRTSGEQRVSNFLLWQLAYTELWFTESTWPEFDRTHLDRALNDFRRRQRRFGRTSEQVAVPPAADPADSVGDTSC